MSRDDLTLTLAEGAAWVGRTPRTVLRWVAAGQLTPCSYGQAGHLYRLSDLLRVERNMRRRVDARRAHLARKLTA